MLQQLASAGEFESLPDVSVTTEMCIAVQQYQSPLLRYAEQILRHEPDQAHDVVQEVFICLHRAYHDDLGIENVKSWL